jgi:DNA-binding response OmpR family regulator
MQSNTKRILLVEDDVQTLDLMKTILEMEGYQVVTALNGIEAVRLFRETNPSMVLLDLMLPYLDGFTVCQRLRQESQVPVIMVTGKVSEEDKLKGYEVGADDYITKPFSSRELVARVDAVFRRSRIVVSLSNQFQPAANIFQYQDLRIDFESKLVTLNNVMLDLTPPEYKILCLFARNANKILSDKEILREIWNESHVPDTNLVKVNIARLRRKLKENGRKPEYIQTRSGLGYFLKTGTEFE